MRKVLTTIFILLPLAAMAYLRLASGADLSAPLPIFHFYIVTFTTFSAGVIAIMLTITLGESARPRHVLAAVAFAAIGSIFFSHGLATPGALIDFFHPAVSWSAWLTLLAGGLIFSIGALSGNFRPLQPGGLKGIATVMATLITLYLGIAALKPEWLDRLGAQVDPWHTIAIYGVTLAAWLISSLGYLRLWITERNRVDGVLSFVALWLAIATVSMHSFPLWNLSWWLYHFLLLIGFLVTIVFLAREYESARQFNLLRYYVGISLVFTALLALIASDLFTRAAIDSLSAEISRQTRARVQALTSQVAQTLPAGIDAENAFEHYELALDRLPAFGLIIYDNQARFVYPYKELDSGQAAEVPPDSVQGYQAAMAGQVRVEVREPGMAPERYAPPENVHAVVSFAPLHDNPRLEGPPIGVLQLVEESSELTGRALQARSTSLGITALTMTILFLALLLVVRRADNILVTRTGELNKAYQNLQRSEVLRDEMTKMIVHDLKNPLSAIAASVDLLKMTAAENENPVQEEFTDLAQDASMRLTALVEDILAVNSYEAQELVLDLENILLQPLLRERLDGFRAQASSEDKALILECPSDLHASTDPVLFGRVIDNLVGNAIKYTRIGEGRIVVSATLENGKVIFHVRDNGEGIPDEYKEKIFDKFIQVPSSQRHSFRKGSGLGLTFCRMVMDLHGGEISVRDSEGGGSDFEFWIPLKAQQK